MSDGSSAGTWLLLDAAGPELVTGLLREDRWVARNRHQGGFLESLQPSVKALLEASSLGLPDLSGAVSAAGPGSTLGLRHSAMFLRSLLGLPALSHWSCCTYNNLALAGCGLIASGQAGPFDLAAPWRRNRLHLATFQSGPPLRITTQYRDHHPDAPYSGVWVQLGTRDPSHLRAEHRIPYPVERIPEILAAFPEILEPASQPAPLQLDNPAFAPWSGERHARA
ncbi:MAG: hypothetical protein R6V45_08910 [Oceanipulchritudo sp.]